MAFKLNPDDSVTIDISALRKIIQLAGSDFEGFFHTIATESAKLLGADGAALIQQNETGAMYYRFFHGLPAAFQQQVLAARIPPGTGTVGEAVQTGQPLFTPDYPNSPYAIPEFTALGLQANLIVPINLSNQELPITVLAISWFNRKPMHAPQPAQLELIRLYGDFLQAGLARQAMIDAWQQQANRDALTGLPNRRALMTYLPVALERTRRQQHHVAICIMDLDGFKQVNDHFGHAAGDILLMELAYRLKAIVRLSDFVARLGGDEFVFVLEDVASQAQLEGALHRIYQTIDTPFILPEGQPVRVDMSIGATLYPDDNSNADCLLRHADHALYYIKDHRQTIDRYWVLWDPRQDPDMHHRDMVC